MVEFEDLHWIDEETRPPYGLCEEIGRHDLIM